jgi:putative oxidoreductase
MFVRLLKSFEEPAYALLRIGSGLMFCFHGVQKVFGVLSDRAPAIGTQVWVGGVIELVAGVLLALGAFTRCAAFVSSGTMAVAYTQFHWKLQGGAQLLPGVNKGELALVYALLFLFIACHGAGRYSVDARRHRA